MTSLIHSEFNWPLAPLLNKDKELRWYHNNILWCLIGSPSRNQFGQIVLCGTWIYCHLQNIECSLWICSWDRNPCSFQMKQFDHRTWIGESSLSIKIVNSLKLQNKNIINEENDDYKIQDIRNSSFRRRQCLIFKIIIFLLPYEIISKHGINEEFGIGVIFILADRFATPPVKGVL